MLRHLAVSLLIALVGAWPAFGTEPGEKIERLDRTDETDSPPE
ncbi:MAG TPA: hypothetical protein VM243_14490 [Phycisphaerae bacterium]|nr:hypothetical protein [Phycisphaerae bacterium]